MHTRIFPNRLDQLVRPCDDTRGHVAMAVEVLCGGVHDEIDAEGQRKLIETRSEGVVRDDNRALRMGQRRNGFEIGQSQGRVGRGFRVDEACFRTDRLGKRRDVGLVDLRDLYALARQPFCEKAEGCGVMRSLRDDVIASAHIA